MAPGPDGRQRHLSAVWDVALEARGVQGTLRISFPCPIVVMGGSNLPEGQELVGMFAYRLVSGHWRVQTGVARTWEEGTVTTAWVLGLNVITGWQQRKAEWVDVAWLAMRVHVGRQRKGGIDVIDVEGEDDAPPHPLGPEAESPPPQGDTNAPPQKAPRTATPEERAEPAAGRGQRGAVGEWVEQQHQLQRAGAGEVRAMSAEAANCDLDARLSRANDDRRATETRLAEVTKERDRLVTRVKTLERDLGTARKATGAPAKPLAYTGEGAEGTEGPPVERAGRGGGGGAMPPVSGTFWPARRPGMPRPGHAPATCQPCRPASGWPCWRVASRWRWTPWRPTWPASMPPTRTCAGSTPPTASRQRPWTPLSLRRWWSRAPRAPLAGALLQGGGGGA